MSNKAFATESELEPFVNEPNVLAQQLNDRGAFPNSKLPLLLYRGAVSPPEHDPAAIFEQLFSVHGW